MVKLDCDVASWYPVLNSFQVLERSRFKKCFVLFFRSFYRNLTRFLSQQQLCCSSLLVCERQRSLAVLCVLALALDGYSYLVFVSLGAS
jgi:hypothetical protein